MLKTALANLVRRLSESGARLDPDDPRFDSRLAREALAVRAVDVPTVDGLVWVSMNADGTLAGVEVDLGAFYRGEDVMAAHIADAIKNGQRLIDEAIAIVVTRQRNERRHGQTGETATAEPPPDTVNVTLDGSGRLLDLTVKPGSFAVHTPDSFGAAVVEAHNRAKGQRAD
ncbi:hypothetical protein Snas_2519 [Stackebrandtia nassauensis DSM 44728]|uniref:Uncharacterized protein n=1 Tax=Stackebrandtia nassauensis (strain DSM 44728 / CIP 108903 / NRRL B-16338 / NBRC 102104 / LLR-40K-21) TaxID=446470 RepID=D3Q626_STANL|nr:hypothetical protein Snas_2519 [Stackebrandtia nassauensis DSM 44728]